MQGCKRTLSAVLQRLEADPDASFSVDAIWEALCVLTRQTVDAISQQVMASQRASEGAQRCFHIVGLDVLLDVQGKPWLLEANYRPSLLIDEVHPLASGQSRAEVNRFFAAGKQGSGPKWGRPCRCSLHPSLHEHQLCPADVAAKCPAIEGALTIARRAKESDDIARWADGTAYQLV